MTPKVVLNQEPVGRVAGQLVGHDAPAQLAHPEIRVVVVHQQLQPGFEIARTEIIETGPSRRALEHSLGRDRRVTPGGEPLDRPLRAGEHGSIQVVDEENLAVCAVAPRARGHRLASFALAAASVARWFASCFRNHWVSQKFSLSDSSLSCAAIITSRAAVLVGAAESATSAR